MQQQVMKRNMSSDMGWGIGEGGGWGQHTSAPGSGSWTSTANQDNSSSSWQAMSKSDNASDAGDDASSVKSGSTITNSSNINPQQSQDSTSTTSAVSSSSPWSANPSLSGMDSGPWGNSSSPAPTSLNSLGWNANPASLSLNSNQGHNNSMQPGPSVIGSSSSFNSTSTASSGWPTGMSGSSMASTSSLPPNVNTGMPSGNLSSQWPGSNMLGKMGDFQKTSDAAWNNPTSSIMENKDLSGSSDPRMWGMVDKTGDQNWDPPKSHWGNTPIAGSGDQGASNGTELSFAQATLKGLKVPPSAGGAPPSGMTSRQEEILRAIENHEGWGSRPVRQDTSWDIDNSPKSHRKFTSDNSAGASNVWNNSNGTAIWEAVRENQGSNWAGASGGGASGNTWNADKDQGWGGPPKPQDPNTWGVSGAGGNGDPKSFGTWEGGGAGDASNKMWGGQKTVIGSWGEVPNVQRSTSISSWGDDGETGSWEDQRRITGGMSSMQGMVPPSPGMNAPSMAGMMPQGVPGMNMAGIGADSTPWNSANAAAMSRPKMDEPWNKPPPKISGWGDPTQDGVKVDDGTGIWAANAPKQAKTSGWGDAGPQGQWNSAVGAKPKAPGGWDEASWAMAQRTKQIPPKYMNASSNPPTQMRSKLLQHLMDMGYRKEEAQNALITNNMNLELAINDLKTNNGMQRKDLEMDMFQANGPQSRMPYMSKGGLGVDDMGDTHPDQVPNFSTNLQNTPFPNAQAPNQPFIQGNASLPPSSLNHNSSINPNLQQKLMQKMQQVPPTNALGPRGQMPPVGGVANNQVPQQQQQQILAQLRQAVSNGYISPQLLNYQLPHNILVLLQQLLQLQTARQSVINKLQQARASGNRGNQQQLDQMPSLINNINQQINNLQKQLQQAQTNLFSTQKMPNMPQPPSGMMTPIPGPQQGAVGENIDAISTDLANVAISQSQSRLTTQWKASSESSSTADGSSTPTMAASTGATADGEDKSGKGLLQSSSSPNMNLIPGGLGMTGDRTWSSMSTTSSSNWPMSSNDGAGTNSQADPKISNPSSTSTSSILSGMPTGLTDVIPEFVPGKPWQGLSTKNVEDDPHVTPGSIIQRSLSVNRVHDDSLSNLDGHKLSGSNWGNSLKNENSLGLSQLGNRPPPGMAPAKMAGSQQWQTGSPFNRQASWAGRSNTSAFTQVGSPNWNDQSQLSSWILLKNLNSSLDSATVRALCAQHGNLTNFIPQGQAALVQYTGRDLAYNAVQRLNNFQVGNTIIGAELISENEAQRAVSQIPPPQPSPAMPHINASQWSHAPPTFQSGGARGGDPWGNGMHGHQHMSKFGSVGGDPWGGSGLWSDMNSMADHNSNQLLSNILGGESM
ncbi:trinucleotide repeat-containing gene 6B protein isoform X2 [Aplysia californica]|uniref:Trinucleotide repeat-containing gene 6B protein isoform X2 n=1 Tax=Aplysia californica TaxID=6500 RepID=A0ABM0JHM4_APLCA|nr:trinucleotide repeat-containing gene 6B protein isoform X2 [Aplysia californica]